MAAGALAVVHAEEESKNRCDSAILQFQPMEVTTAPGKVLNTFLVITRIVMMTLWTLGELFTIKYI